MRVGERAVKSVDCVLEDTRAGWQRDGDMLTVTLESLHVWELVRIRWKEMKEE